MTWRRTGYSGREFRYPLVTPPDGLRAMRVFGTVNDLETYLRLYDSATDRCTGNLERLTDAPNVSRLLREL